MSKRRVKGSCLCGAVEYSVDTDGGLFQYCHCERCRKTSGSAHAANLIVPAGQFRWLRGEDRVRQHEYAGARRFCNAFCLDCGSKLPWRSRDGRWMIVTAGTLDEDPGLRPKQSIFMGSGAPWYVEPGAIPAHHTLPPSGD